MFSQLFTHRQIQYVQLFDITLKILGKFRSFLRSINYKVGLNEKFYKCNNIVGNSHKFTSNSITIVCSSRIFYSRSLKNVKQLTHALFRYSIAFILHVGIISLNRMFIFYFLLVYNYFRSFYSILLAFLVLIKSSDSQFC